MNNATLVRTLSASSLIGDDVKDKNRKDIGEVKDLVLDLERGKIQYAVLEFGGFFGLGSKYFAIPFEALQIDTENKECILSVNKDTLEKAEGFDKDNWPNFADPSFNERVYTHYGYKPYWN